MNNIMNNPELIACHTAGCAKGLDYFEYTHYLEYYDFLTELEEDGDTGPDSICEKLDSIRDYLCNSNGAVIGCAITESEKEAYNKIADAFIGKLENSARQPCEYELFEHEYPLGIITLGQVVSNAVTTNASDLDIEANSPASSVVLSIITDKYLRGETRDRYGAYVCSYMDRYPAFSLFTGKDPTTGAAFEAIGAAADAWKEIRAHLTQEELDGYIITMHSSESMSNGKISDAMNVVSDMVAGWDSSYRNERLKMLKDLQTDDLSRYDALFEKLSKEGNRVSAGSADMIKKDAGNYAQVINQFAK